MANELKFNSPIVLARVSADPSSPYNGEMYYNTTSNIIRAYVNGAWTNVSTGVVSLTGQTLNEFNVIVGNNSNISAAVDSNALGDITVSTAGGLAIKTGVIVNANINASAAIAYSKLSLTGSILNADINASAAIAYSKLSLTGNIVNADINASAAIDYSKLNLSTSIVNADINASAAIALTKLAALTASRATATDASGFIVASSVTDTELGYVSGVTSAIQTQLGNKLNLSGGTLSGNLAMGGNKITGLGSPTASTDAANKLYVDSVAEGLKPKAAVRVSTTANITLSGTQTIDGISAIAGNRVLVKDQTLTEDNGIYIVAAGAWSRSTDFDSLSPIDEINGALVAVQEGTANAGKVFVQTGTVATLGTDPINFVFFNSNASLVGGDGITVSGSNIEVDHDGQGLQFSGVQLSLELDGSTLSKSASGLKVATGGITNTEVSGSAAIAYSKLNLSSSIVNADIASAAAIDRTKLASGTADHVIINDGSGVLSSEAQLSLSRGGFGQDVTMTLTNGAIPIGNAGALTFATITSGTGINVTSAAGSITINNNAVRADDIPDTTFNGANNVVAAANVTNLLFSTTSVSAFQAIVSVGVDAATDLYETFTLNGVYRVGAGNWDLTSTSNGDNSQVVFSITNGGQVQYTSGNYATFVTLKMRFRAITVSNF